MTECGICIKAYTDKLRKKIVCCNCQYETCKSCLQQYCYSKMEPQCMNCHQIFDQTFCLAEFGRTSSEKMDKNKFENIFQQECSLLPETIKKIQIEKNKEIVSEIEQKIQADTFTLEGIIPYINKIEKHKLIAGLISLEIKDCPSTLRLELETTFTTNQGLVNTIKCPQRKQLVLNEIQTYKYILCLEEPPARIKRHNKNIYLKKSNELQSAMERKKEIEASLASYYLKLDKYIDSDINFRPYLKCIYPDCRGYLDLLHVCMLCKCKVCHMCKEEKKVNHTCDPELVKTMKAIERESRPCPKCNARISKQSGCNQMFCIICNTAFNYTTGEIENGKIHNPHYFEWRDKKLKETPVSFHQPIDCIDDQELHRELHYFLKHKLEKGQSSNYLSGCIKLLKLAIHIREHYIITQEEQNPVTRFEHLRRRYISKEWTEEQWKQNLLKHVRKYEERFKRYLLNDCFFNIVIDACKIILSHIRNNEIPPFQDKFNEICNFVNYYNKTSLDISEYYNYSQFLYISCNNYTEEWKSCTKNDIIDKTFITQAFKSLSICDWMNETEKKFIEEGKKLIHTPPSITQLLSCIQLENDCKQALKRSKQKKQRIEFLDFFKDNFMDYHIWKNKSIRNIMIDYDTPLGESLKAPYYFFVMLFYFQSLENHDIFIKHEPYLIVYYKKQNESEIKLENYEPYFMALKWIEPKHLKKYCKFLYTYFNVTLDVSLKNELESVVSNLKNNLDVNVYKYLDAFF
jgi:hypothetical protein